MSRRFSHIIPEELKRETIKHKTIEKKESNVLCPCPEEECRGFIIKPDYKCGLCETKICSHCHMRLSADSTEHTCKEEDIETARFVKKTSKPCPKCASPIHKISGCDQMWCTQCNTPFSWTTGQVISTETIHNPHYYEWMQNRRIDENAYNGCEGMPDYSHVLRHVRIVYNNNKWTTTPFMSYISKIHRFATHLQAYNNEQEEHAQVFRTNLESRMKWMKKEITDKVFDSVLHKRYKHRIVQQKIRQVNHLMATLCADVFHRLLRETDDTNRDSYTNEFKEIFEYGNKCFGRLNQVYKVVMPIYAEHLG